MWTGGGQCHPIHLTMFRKLSSYTAIGGGALGENFGSVCRQDSQTLSLEYTSVAKNIPLNIQISPTITGPVQFRGKTYHLIGLYRFGKWHTLSE